MIRPKPDEGAPSAPGNGTAPDPAFSPAASILISALAGAIAVA